MNLITKFLLVCACAALSAVALSTDSFHGLGATFVAYGISGDGNVVVGTAPSGSGRQAAYADSGGTVYLLPGPVGSIAKIANFDGSVVAGDDGTGKLVQWVHGAMHYIAMPNASKGEIDCMSADGAILIGRLARATGTFTVKWLNGSTVVPFPAPDDSWWHPTACSADASNIAGFYAHDYRSGFEWLDGNGLHSSPAFSSDGRGKWVNPIGIDVNGGILASKYDFAPGYMYTDVSNYGEIAYNTPATVQGLNFAHQWVPIACTTDLLISSGAFADPNYYCNHDCVTIGNLNCGAVVASPSLGMRFVQDLLKDSGIDVTASGWYFGPPGDPVDERGTKNPTGAVIGMSKDGQTYVGWGSHNSNTEYWVAHLDPHLINFAVDPFGGKTSFIGGSNITTAVEAFPGAGLNGIPATFTSDNVKVASLPASVTIEPQTCRKLFFVRAHGVSSETVAAVHVNCLGSTKSASFHVLPADLKLMSPPPAPVQNGQLAQMTVRLNGWAGPQGAAINISSSDSPVLAPVHNMAVVPQDRSSVQFAVKGGPVNQPTVVTITATYRGLTLKSDVTVVPPALVSLDSVDGPYVYGSRPATLVVALSGNAPPGGAVVSLTSSNSAVASPASSSVTVPAGAPKVSFTVNTSKVSADTSVTITATYQGVQKTKLLRVEAARQISLSGNLFKPQTVYAAHGDLIVFTNTDATAHTVTLDKSAGPNSDQQYPNGFKQGQTYTYTVPYSVQRGTSLYYHDRFFGTAGNGSSFGTGMAGVIIVH
jgi:plastocyanin